MEKIFWNDGFAITIKGEDAMASCSKKTHLIRDRKDHPNKANQKSEKARLAKNYAILGKLATAK